MLTIGEMARTLEGSVATVPRWDRAGRRSSTGRTVGNQRRYAEPKTGKARRSLLSGRVSGHDQKPDLERQKQRLLARAARPGWISLEAITDPGPA